VLLPHPTAPVMKRPGTFKEGSWALVTAVLKVAQEKLATLEEGVRLTMLQVTPECAGVYVCLRACVLVCMWVCVCLSSRLCVCMRVYLWVGG